MKTIGLLIVLLLMASVSLAVYSFSRDQNDLIKQLKSDDWEQRAKAFYKLRSIDTGPEEKEVKNVLLDLLDRENQLLKATLRESNGEKGVSIKYGEAYSEYYSDLFGFVKARSDLSDKRTLSIIIHGAYHPDSVFAQELLSRGEEVIPILLEMSRNDFFGERWHSVVMLEQLISKHRGKISDQTAERIKQVLTEGLSDNNEMVRRQATESLQKIKNYVTAVYALQKQDGAARPSQILPTELQSDDWNARFKAFEQIKGRNDDRTRTALIELLERENVIISEAVLSRNPISVYNEKGYSTYYAQVYKTVWKHVDNSPDQRALVALAHGWESLVVEGSFITNQRTREALEVGEYDPNIALSNWLAGQKSLISTFLEMAKSNSPFDREKAIATLGKMIVGLRDLPVEVRQEIRQAVEQAQYDSEPVVRRWATEAINKLNDEKPH